MRPAQTNKACNWQPTQKPRTASIHMNPRQTQTSTPGIQRGMKLCVVGSNSLCVSAFTQPAKVSGLKNTKQVMMSEAPMDQAKRLGMSGF
jgi:hypothetical protein